MSDEIKLFKLPPAKYDTRPQNLIFQALFNGFIDPIFLGWSTKGELVLECEAHMTVDRAVRLLEQAKLQAMGLRPR